MYLSNIGMMYSSKKDYDRAEEYILEALKLHQEMEFNAEISRDLLGLGVVYKEKKLLDGAGENIREALEIALETGDYWAIATCYENLSEINVLKGNLNKALEEFKLFKTYNDSIITEENREKIAELEVKYQTEKKEKENLVLQQEVEISGMTIRQKNTQISIFIVVIIVVLALLIVIFVLFRQKSRSYAALVRQNLKSLEIEKKLEESIVQNRDETSPELSVQDQRLKDLSIRLKKFIVEEKPYLWAEVNMEEFCLKLDTNRTYLSKVINDQFNQSFQELLCEYRVRAARDLLADPSNNLLSVEGIGEMAGFNNNATFHRKFKGLVSLTPKQFRDKALASVPSFGTKRFLS
nr:helix-turn-helix domain-containing protein [Bacteroidota bacterium]